MRTSPEEVWAALIDHDSWAKWFEAILDVEPRGEPATGPGSKRRVTIQHGITIDEEVILWEPNRAWGFTVFAAGGPFSLMAHSLNERINIEALAENRVRATYLMGWDPKPGWKFIFQRVLQRGMQKKLSTALDELSRYLERTRREANQELRSGN